jgi:hypothetical protein
VSAYKLDLIYQAAFLGHEIQPIILVTKLPCYTAEVQNVETLLMSMSELENS